MTIISILSIDTATKVFGAMSAVAALGVMILGYLTWIDKKEREDRAAKIAEDETAKAQRLDLLTAGQTSLDQALRRADEENANLRRDLADERHERLRERTEFDERIRGWQRRVEKQEDQILTLSTEVRLCKEDCKILKQQLGDK